MQKIPEINFQRLFCCSGNHSHSTSQAKFIGNDDTNDLYASYLFRLTRTPIVDVFIVHKSSTIFQRCASLFHWMLIFRFHAGPTIQNQSIHRLAYGSGELHRFLTKIICSITSGVYAPMAFEAIGNLKL